MAEKQLYLHTSNRAENLARQLVEVASWRPLPGLLSKETVMTLNPGMARWLQFQIAQRASIALSWEFPLPGKLFSRIFSGFEPRLLEEGTFSRDAAQWILLDILSDIETAPRFSLLHSYCKGAAGEARRLALARQLAARYDEYLLYRPETLLEWEERPELSRHDWQAELWRRLASRLFAAKLRAPHIARAARKLSTIPAGDDSRGAPQWPERLFVFGVSSLAPLYIRALEAFSCHRPVHLFALQPSDQYWSDLRTLKQSMQLIEDNEHSSGSQGALDDDGLSKRLHLALGNPLLPSLGKQGQHFLDLLIDADPQHEDSGFDRPDPAISQLSSLQSDLFELRDRGKEENCDPYPEYDGSIQFHSCCGARREIETLWDFLVDRFERSPELKPSQVLVMAPDIQKYSSHIEAVFQAKKGTALELPYSIADGSELLRPGPIGGFATLLDLLSKRASSVEVLELLETPLIRESFAFSERDLDTIELWIRELGTSWGWHSRHRESMGALTSDRRTWKELRSRLLSGCLLSQEILVPDGSLAYPEVEGELVETAGRFAALLDLAENLWSLSEQRYSTEQWRERLNETLAALQGQGESWQRQFAQLRELIAECLPPVSGLFVKGMDVFKALREKLSALDSRSGYLSGGVTFCSLKPMRAIPSDTLCLIGLNRAEFPRSEQRQHFDLMGAKERAGDRNSRDEDRQCFLETLLSARSRLYISYQGQALSSENEREPSSLVSELMNYLRSAMRSDDAKRLLTVHRRRSYDEAYFSGALPLTYDPDRASLRNRFALAPSSLNAAPAQDCSMREARRRSTGSQALEIELDDLIAAFTDPSKRFATTVLGARLACQEDALTEDEALEPGPLLRYQLRQELVGRLFDRKALDEFEAAAQLQKGRIAQGRLGAYAFTEHLEEAELLASELGGRFATRSCSFEYLLAGACLTGELDLVESDGSLLIVHPGEINAKRSVEDWIRHLVASLAISEFSGESLVYSIRDPRKPLRYIKTDSAAEHLKQLLAWYQIALEQPLPFIPMLSEAAYKALGDGKGDDRCERRMLAAKKARAKIKTRPDQFGRYEWSEYDRICHGSEFQADNRFLDMAEAFWSLHAASLEERET